MNQLDLFDNLKPQTISEKDLAIESANNAQERRIPGWNWKAFNLLKKYAKIHQEFMAEEFRYWAEENGLEHAQEPRAYGAVFLKARRAGIIFPTGKYKPMRAPHAHGSPKQVWRSVQGSLSF